jgi:hypothetical protein
MGLIMGSQNVICLDYGSNISASTHIWCPQLLAIWVV